MKRRGASRTKHSKKSSFDDNKFLIIGVGLFLVFAFLLMVMNNAPQNVTSTGYSVISDFFTKWSTGDFDTNIAKFLFWIIVLILLASAFSFVKFPGNGFLRFLLALIVSFLATAYITPKEVFSLLAGYSALGLTLISIVPLLSIFMFSAMLLSNEGPLKNVTIGKIIIQFVLWVFYVVFLVWKLIAGIASGQVSLAINVINLSLIFLILSLIVSLIVIIFNKKFRTWLWGIGDNIRDMRENALSSSEAAHERGRHRVQEARDNVHGLG